MLQRTARTARQLEKVASNHNVWALRRWASLDSNYVDTTANRAVLAAVKQVPPHVWAALHRRSGTPSLYASTQRSILLRLRR
jgi:hypothetical protein